MDQVLSIINVNKKFDGTVALDNFSLEIPRDSITGIIGPNGAGKTTLFNAITGFLPLDSGKIIYNSKNLSRMPSYKIARAGIARTFQQLRLITRMTVQDNILLSFQNQAGEQLKNTFLFPGRVKNQEEKNQGNLWDAPQSISLYRQEVNIDCLLRFFHRCNDKTSVVSNPFKADSNRIKFLQYGQFFGFWHGMRSFSESS